MKPECSNERIKMIEFSTKVTFMYNGKKFIGRICNQNEDGTYDVVTTGEDGALWNLPERLLSIVPTPPPFIKSDIESEN